MRQFRMHPLLKFFLPAFFVFGGLFASHLVSGLQGDPNIWWSSSRLPVDHRQSRDVFEIYLKGQSLDQAITEKRLAVITPDGQPMPLAWDDITVRLNSWPRVKANSLALAALFGFLFGGCLAMVITGMILPTADRREPAPGGQPPSPTEP